MTLTIILWFKWLSYFFLEFTPYDVGFDEESLTVYQLWVSAL